MFSNKNISLKFFSIVKKLLMENVKYFYVVAIISLIFWSCAPLKSGGGKSGDKGKAYNEDLSVYRPRYESPKSEDMELGELNATKQKVTPAYDVTSKINTLLDSAAYRNRENKTYSGFTIQIYSGNSREAAVQAKENVYKLMPNSSPEISYIQPNYRVKIGKFIERLEAQRYYMEIRQDFPNATIIPEKISMER
jgi:hypothetical protein